MRRASVGLALMAAGCGAGNATATNPHAQPVATITKTTTTATNPTRPVIAFPARSALDVVRLAMLRPDGRVVYHVTIAGTRAVSYQLSLSSDARHAVIDQRQATGEVWVEFDLARRVIGWSCVAVGAATPTCQRGDPAGSAVKTAATIDRLFGNQVIDATFATLGSGAALGIDRQLGLQVSCMATNATRLCATKDGYITQMTSGPTTLLAQSVARTAPAADLAPPAPLA
jgi:hypothetical protein